MFACGSLLGVGQHALDGSCVGLINVAGLTVATGQLGGLLGQDVAAECMTALDLAVLGQLKALLSAGVIRKQSNPR